MPNERKQAPLPAQEIPVIELKDFKGLSLKPDIANRPPQSWRRLDNFDLYIPGSIRKVNPPALFGTTTTQILSVMEYKQDDASPKSIWGIGADGFIYDFNTAIKVNLGLGPISVPVFTALLPGTWINLADPGTFTAWIPNAVYVAGPNSTIMGRGPDGQLYAFQAIGVGSATTGATWPIWPTTLGATVIDGTVTWKNVGIITGQRFVRNFLVILVPGFQPIKFDPTTGQVTQIGVSAPSVPLLTAPHLSANLTGLVLVTGRYYSWTFWNPKTLHESAPAPIQGATTRIDGTANTGSFVGPSSASHSYDSILLQIPTGALTPAIGQGFTHIRFYATKDGGSQLFLIQTIYHDTGTGTYIESDPNGAVPIALMASGIGGLFSPPSVGGSVQITQAADGNLSLPAVPTPDTALNFPAPAFTDHYPPPKARWGAIFQGSLIVQDDISANLLWPSNPGDFESFGQFNSINLLNENDDDIVALAGGFNQLIVSTPRRVDSLTGDLTNISSLTRSPIDSLHGFLGRRAMFPLGSSIVGLMRQGFATLGLSMSFGATSGNVQLGYGNDALIGDDILPLLNDIKQSALLSLICIAIDNTQNILVFAIQNSAGVTYNNVLLLYSMGQIPGWSRYIPPFEVTTVREILWPDGSVAVVALDSNGDIFKLFQNPTGSPLTAIAETQAIPTPTQVGADLWDTSRVFQYFYVEGQDLSNFTFQWSTDGSSFKPPTPQPLLPGRNIINDQGKQIVLRFIHSVVPVQVPLISYIKLGYTVSGRIS